METVNANDSKGKGLSLSQRAYVVDERQIARQLANNPDEGLAALLDAYGGAGHSIIRGSVGFLPNTEQEEILSQCLFEAWRHIGRWQPDKGSLKSWFYAICRHQAIDRLRRVDKTALPLEEDLIDVANDTEDAALQNLNATIVQQAVEELPSPEKEIFIYRFFFGWRVKQVAEKLLLPEKKVENLLHRTKPKLRQRLLELGVNI